MFTCSVDTLVVLFSCCVAVDIKPFRIPRDLQYMRQFNSLSEATRKQFRNLHQRGNGR